MPSGELLGIAFSPDKNPSDGGLLQVPSQNGCNGVNFPLTGGTVEDPTDPEVDDVEELDIELELELELELECELVEAPVEEEDWAWVEEGAEDEEEVATSTFDRQE
jgi:hypothetical protein